MADKSLTNLTGGRMSNELAAILGMVTIVNKKTGQEKMLDVRGFDVLGFFFPFLRYLFAGQLKMVFFFCLTFFAYPIWSWYTGFSFKRLNFEKHLKTGWELKKDTAAKAS